MTNRDARLGLLVALVHATLAPAAKPTTIAMSDPLTFPESMSALPNGTLFIGSSARSSVYRAAPGDLTAREWIKSDAVNGLAAVFGVLADRRGGTLWVCSNHLGGLPGTGAVNAVKAFDIATGTLRRSYDLPSTGLCNDIAAARDGTLYVTDMSGQVLRLGRGATSLEIWRADTALVAADGIVARPDEVLVNVIRTGKLFRIAVMPDGSAGTPQEITTDRPLGQPDGMRAGSDGRLYLAEGAGSVARLDIRGTSARVTTLMEGLESPTGITTIGGRPWVIEGKLGYRMNPALRGKDPGPFAARAVPSPTR